MHRKLPFRITLLISLVLYTTCWQVIRLSASLAWSVTLKTYEPFPGTIYIGITGAFWALTGLFLLWSMWTRRHWTRMAFVIASSLYAAWVWADRILIQTQMRANWPFDLVATVLLLLFAFIVVLDPSNKIYFERETYERES